jgi:sugar phosphate permease
MNAVLLAVGNLGAIVASTPFAWFIQKIGWRSCFFAIAAFILLLSILSWKYIQDTPPGYAPVSEEKSPGPSPGESRVADILKNPLFWTMLALFYTYGGPYSTFQGLWGYSFLIDVFGYGKLEAGNLVMIIALGVILGGPALGYLADKNFASRKPAFLSICLGIQVLNWGFIVFLSPDSGTLALGSSLFIMGMTLSGTLSLVWAIVREESPPGRMGTAMGLLNPAPFLAVATLQPLTGYLMDRVGRSGNGFPLEAYQHAFLLCLSSIFFSLLISFLLLKTRPPG